ncbi:L-ascorbate metabolism protein UlaG (beta-lactamase superfamily) [Lutibacter sp. Hel_I_33_5]|uniref:MBL fold metallo-hydrolase n=1 Tax=Lutibacter sp. Hel_I_33_5 TaxID=1566289 RepID=UPI0011A4562E|nr:MBL fold metallo-hydrolase [Lutibacter sp. Hel_I_33_5]TVZ57193.1 L-ascorbate metabolism protein UlaG (beta-lactamase superfamily) [Lutibacter sp. Hel_I_33_5]
MKLLFTCIAFLSFSITNSQNTLPPSDIINTGYGSLKIQPIKHGSLVLSYNNKTIYVDPTGGKVAYTGLKSPDIILITDIHGDHFNLKTIEELSPKKAIIIAPNVVAEKLPEPYKSNTVVLKNDQAVHRLGFYINAIAMYNRPEAENAKKHTKGRGNGYVVSIRDFDLYISGDTAAIQEMRMLQNIDIAFVCMNLPYTMDINEAADGVLDFNPKIVYPYHYRGKGMISDTSKFKELVNSKNKNIEVRLRNWYQK